MYFKFIRVVVHIICAIYEEFSHYYCKILILNYVLKNIDSVTSNEQIKFLLRFTFLGHIYVLLSMINRYSPSRLLPWFFYQVVRENIYFMSIFTVLFDYITISFLQEIVDDSQIFTLKLWS